MTGCKGECNGIREAEYMVSLGDGEIHLYITSNGLDRRVVAIDRVEQSAIEHT